LISLEYLYHGTSALNLDRIKKLGICGKPRGSKVPWSFRNLISFSPYISYSNRYASGITKEMSVDIEKYKEKYKDVYDLPGMILRVKKSDVLQFCEELPAGKIIAASGWSHVEMKCKKNCIKISMDYCVLKSKRQVEFRKMHENDYSKTEKLLYKYCSNRWMPLLFES